MSQADTNYILLYKTNKEVVTKAQMGLNHSVYVTLCRLLTNQGPDRSGSCLILIRQQPDRLGCHLTLIWHVPDWSGSCLILIRQQPDRSGCCLIWSAICLINQAAAWFWSGSSLIDQPAAWFWSVMCLIDQAPAWYQAPWYQAVPNFEIWFVPAVKLVVFR